MTGTHPIMEPAGHAIRARLRVFALAWTVVCVALGGALAAQVLGMRDGTHAMEKVSTGLVATSESLERLADVPLVGGAIDDAAGVIAASGADVGSSARDLDRSLLALAWLMGIAIAVLPTVPVIAMWWLVESLARERA